MIPSNDYGEDGGLLAFGVVLMEMAQGSIFGRAGHRVEVWRCSHSLEVATADHEVDLGLASALGLDVASLDGRVNVVERSMRASDDGDAHLVLSCPASHSTVRTCPSVSPAHARTWRCCWGCAGVPRTPLTVNLRKTNIDTAPIVWARTKREAVTRHRSPRYLARLTFIPRDISVVVSSMSGTLAGGVWKRDSVKVD